MKTEKKEKPVQVYDHVVREMIGVNIKNSRIDQKISQLKFAKELGLSRATLVSIEAGKRAISVTTVYKVAALLNVDVHLLLPSVHEVLSDNANYLMATQFSDLDDFQKIKALHASASNEEQ